MITKILFTIGVIIAGMAYARYRAQQGMLDRPSQPREKLVNPAPVNKPKRMFSVATLAGAAVVVMILASGLMLYQSWVDSNKVVYIKVVEAGSGASAEYQAYRGDIDDRSFTTTDGRLITLATTERMETTLNPRPQN